MTEHTLVGLTNMLQKENLVYRKWLANNNYFKIKGFPKNANLELYLFEISIFNGSKLENRFVFSTKYFEYTQTQ